MRNNVKVIAMKNTNEKIFFWGNEKNYFWILEIYLYDGLKPWLDEIEPQLKKYELMDKIEDEKHIYENWLQFSMDNYMETQIEFEMVELEYAKQCYDLENTTAKRIYDADRYFGEMRIRLEKEGEIKDKIFSKYPIPIKTPWLIEIKHREIIKKILREYSNQASWISSEFYYLAESIKYQNIVKQYENRILYACPIEGENLRKELKGHKNRYHENILHCRYAHEDMQYPGGLGSHPILEKYDFHAFDIDKGIKEYSKMDAYETDWFY